MRPRNPCLVPDGSRAAALLFDGAALWALDGRLYGDGCTLLTGTEDAVRSALLEEIGPAWDEASQTWLPAVWPESWTLVRVGPTSDPERALAEERRMVRALEVRVETLHAELEATAAQARTLGAEAVELRTQLLARQNLHAGIPGVGPGIVAGRVS